MSVFLSVEEDMPLGIYLGEENGRVEPLERFFNDSIICLSAKQCERYAKEFEKFTAKLRKGNEI
jgi:hypothetical protein